MLAPIAELSYGTNDAAKVRFGRKSLARYPSFVDELFADSGTRVPLHAHGTLVVALDRDDADVIRRAFEFRRSLDLPVEWLAGSDARAKEPLLSPRTLAAMWIPEEHHVDARALVGALVRACERRGVELREGVAAESVRVHDAAVTGVRTRAGDVDAGVVVLAAGSWSATMPGVPVDIPVRPVKGQILRLRGDDFPLAHVVRTPRAYVLRRADGSVLAGATQEEAGFDTTPTAGAMRQLLDDARDLVPGIDELAFERIEVGLRPASRDHAPIIGDAGVRGLVVATGHYRSGILMAPATADAVVTGLASGRFDDDVAPFSPQRFAR
jgi:glycine oxidase